MKDGWEFSPERMGKRRIHKSHRQVKSRSPMEKKGTEAFFPDGTQKKRLDCHTKKSV